jgi:hypothetical protein
MVTHKTIPILILFSLLFASCGNLGSDTQLNSNSDTTLTDNETIRKAKSIFYYMYLPSEMYKVFEKANAIYSPTVLNPVENVNRYALSAKAAMNLGAYGVDLSYNKIFGQNQKTILYFTVIHKLSQQLGIPDNQFAYAIKRMEKHLSNKDSLTEYAADLFYATNKYLRENERHTTAALIIMGGWIEALFIASSISDENASNIEIVDRIALQKFSLRNLISLLNTYNDDEVVAAYLPLFKDLRKAYEKLDINYDASDMNIDSINNYIRSNNIKLNLTENDIKEIKMLISQIRQEVVN